MIEWRPIVGWEGLYELSANSLVRSVATGWLLGQSWIGPLGNQFLAVTLSRDGKATKVLLHKAVIEAFVGPRPTGLHIAHLDGNRAHNALHNLAYVTPSENEAHKIAHGTALLGERHFRSRLTEGTVTAERQAAADDPAYSVTAAAKALGVHRETLRDALTGRTWGHVPFPSTTGAGRGE